jgi:hypothetical protein
MGSFWPICSSPEAQPKPATAQPTSKRRRLPPAREAARCRCPCRRSQRGDSRRRHSPGERIRTPRTPSSLPSLACSSLFPAPLFLSGPSSPNPSAMAAVRSRRSAPPEAPPPHPRPPPVLPPPSLQSNRRQSTGIAVVHRGFSAGTEVRRCRIRRRPSSSGRTEHPGDLLVSSRSPWTPPLLFPVAAASSSSAPGRRTGHRVNWPGAC